MIASMYDHYKSLLSEIIKKYTVIFGKDITIAKVKKIQGLSISSDGTVDQVLTDPQKIIDDLSEEFSQLCEFVVKKTMGSLVENLTHKIDVSVYNPTKSTQAT